MTIGKIFVIQRWLPAVALGWAVGFSGPGRAVAGDAVPESARWVSAGAVVYLEMPKPAALLDRLSDERLQGPLRAIPALKSALEGEQLAKLKMVAELIAGKLDTTWEKALRELTSGGAILAVEVVEGKKPGVFLVVTPGDPAFLKKTNEVLLELARQDASSKGKPDPVKSVEYRGLTGYVVDDKAVYGIVKDRLLIADRTETAKAVVDRALDGSKGSVFDSPDWTSRRAGIKPETLAFGVARVDRLRQLDPKRFASEAKKKPPEILFLGGWVDAIRNAPNVVASLDWSDSRLALNLALPIPSGGRAEAFKGFVPPKGAGAPALVNPPGTIASVSLWRDYATVWESRTDLFSPEDVQNLAKLDGFAGQFFGGRDFGTGVLGALTSDWRLVIVNQDHKAMKPVPDVKLPAFALIVDLKPDDDDFAERLRVAFQSFIGLVNLGAAQTKAPPLELGSETYEGVTISTSHFMPARKTAESAKEPIHTRHNFSPSVVQVGQHFVLSSSTGLARELVKSLKSPAKATEATLAAEADGAVLAGLVDVNRDRLVMQNMLEKGHDKDQAEAEAGLLSALLRYLNHGRLSVQDAPDATRLGLEFSLGK